MNSQKPTVKDILFYPNVFNPFAWLPGIFAMLYFIIVALFTDRYNRRKILREAFHSFATMIINTAWNNKKKSVAYAHYLKSIWLSFYPYNDVRTHRAIEMEYNYYKRIR